MIHNEYPCGLKIHIDHEKVRVDDLLTCPLHGKTCPKPSPTLQMPYPYPYPEQQGGKQKS